MASEAMKKLEEKIARLNARKEYVELQDKLKAVREKLKTGGKKK